MSLALGLTPRAQMDSSGGSGLPLNSSENDDRGLSLKAVRMVCTASDAESDSFTTTSNIDVMREIRTGMDAIFHDAHEMRWLAPGDSQIRKTSKVRKMKMKNDNLEGRDGGENGE